MRWGIDMDIKIGRRDGVDLDRRGRSSAGSVLLAPMVVLAVVFAGLQAAPASAAAPVVARVWGQTAIDTAGALSRDAFPTGAVTVYIATVSGYWDALSGGAAAARQGGPMLLTEIDRLPQGTQDELTRLKPSTIVIQGGVLAVSQQVEAALAAFAPTVVRNAGDNAIATAVLSSQRAFPDGASSVFVATSDSFYDAVSGGAAAGLTGAPVLLADPDAPVDARVTAEITRLGASTINLLGGQLALPDPIVTQLEATGVPVERLAGETALGTSLAANKAGVPSAQQVYLVTSMDYHDGLAAAPAAVRNQGPVLLTNGRCLEPDMKEYLLWLNPSRVVVVGGTLAMATALDTLAECQMPVTLTSTDADWKSRTFTLQPGSYHAMLQIPAECTFSAYLLRSSNAPVDPPEALEPAVVMVQSPHLGSGMNALYLVPGDTYRLGGSGWCNDDRREDVPWTITLSRLWPDESPATDYDTITSPPNAVEWTSEPNRLAQGDYEVTWQAPTDCTVTLRLVGVGTPTKKWEVVADAATGGSGTLPRLTLASDFWAATGRLSCGVSFTTGAQWTLSYHKLP